MGQTSTPVRSAVVIAVIAAMALGSYLLGTFPSAQLAGRRAGHDPMVEGSGNPGASNVYRVAGRKAGAIVLLADLVKGLAATSAGLVVAGRPAAFICGAAAVVGHVLPVTRRFRGGKGVATAAGMAVALFPLPSVALALLWVAVARISRKASLASISAAAATVPLLIAVGRPAWEIASIGGVVLVVVARHAGNIGRLARGEERSLPGTGTVGP